MTNLRVGISADSALGDRRADGIAVYTRALMQQLPTAGCSVVPYVYSRHSSAESPTPEAVKFPWPFPLQAVAGHLGDMLRIRGPVDVYHSTDFHTVRMDCPVVATLHDAVPLKYPQWVSSGFRRIRNWQIQRSARYADRVIVHARSAIPDVVEHFGVAEERIEVVPCGVDEAWLEPVGAQARLDVQRKHGLVEGYFLFVGTLQPRKNLRGTIGAYRALPAEVRAERQLVIVGQAGWRCEDEVTEIRKAQSAGERIKWLDSVGSRDELKALYASAGVFVFPSLYEGFGIPLLEAFASGVPAVTSNCSSMPEVSAGTALEVDPDDWNALATAMHRLVEDDVLRNRCVAMGLRRAALLSWRHTAALTADVYRKVM